MSTKTPAPIFLKYSMEELHERLGVSKTYLAQMEEGHRPIRKQFRFNACGILNRTPEELFGPDAPSPNSEQLGSSSE